LYNRERFSQREFHVVVINSLLVVISSLLELKLSPFLFSSWWIYRGHTLAKIYLLSMIALYIYLILVILIACCAKQNEEIKVYKM
jgi:hypothetical protein